VILLASRSPQRRALLGALGVEFRVVVAGVDEGPDAAANARAKAHAVRTRAGAAAGAVLAADTEVVLDGRALGKPADAAGAARMLESLAGRAHRVLTAVVLLDGGRPRERVVEAEVRMRPLDRVRLQWYLATGEWRDRAGGYAIQGAGAALVERVEGDPSTVVGLPVGAVAEMLAEAGLGPWAPRH
jgi:septum formation protein